MPKRISKANPGEHSPNSSDSEEKGQSGDMSKEALLNPPAHLVRRPGHYQNYRRTLSGTEDELQSDFERVTLSPREQQHQRGGHRDLTDVKNLSKEERRLLKRLLEEEESRQDANHTDVDVPLGLAGDEEEHEQEDEDDSRDESDENADEEDEEEDEEEPERISAAEKERIISTMPFLTLVPTDDLPTALEIIRHVDFTIEKKLEYLEPYLTKKALGQCEEFLENERCDYLKYAPTDSQKKFAEKVLGQKNYNDLKAIVAGWGPDAVAAFDLWFERENSPREKAEESPKGGKKTPKKDKTPNKTPSKEDKKKDKEAGSAKKDKDEKKTPKKVDFDTPTKGSTAKKDKASTSERKSAKERVKDFVKKGPGVSSPHKTAKAQNYAEIEGVPFNKEIFDSCPETMNIVLMGGTGIGKSTFINNFVNLLSFSSLDDAERNDFHVLIPASFTHITADYQKIPISVKANVKVERLGDVEEQNEVDKAGASATQAPKSYLFSWGPTGKKKHIRLIDTPGVGDTRGTAVDNENFGRILDFIAGFKEIHAICILLKANESRSTLIFRYCHSQLFGHLHASATKNIFFCFTNSRGADYSPGDTYRTLSEDLRNLEHKVDIDGKYFCFDSESFRYLCTRKKGIDFDAEAIKGYRTSFSKSKCQVFRLIEAITKVSPHQVGKTLDVNNVRRLIMALLRPVAEMSRSILITTRMLEEQLREVQEAERKGTDIRQNMNIQVPKLTTEALEYPMNVCTAPRCTERKTIDGIDQIHYKTVCHDHCYIHGVQTSIVNNPSLQRCVALSGHIDRCSNCKCSWNMHMHITYKLKTEMGDAIDSKMLDELKRITNGKDLAEKLIIIYKDRIEELNTEKEKVLVFLIEALAFLKAHSIVPVNDAFIEYLDHMIKHEEARRQHGGDGSVLIQLNEYRDQYKELLRQQKDITTSRVKSTEEMYAMIQQLKRMAQNGDIFKEVQELEVLQLKNLPDGDAKTVDLNIGWLGWIFYKMRDYFLQSA